MRTSEGWDRIDRADHHLLPSLFPSLLPPSFDLPSTFLLSQSSSTALGVTRTLSVMLSSREFRSLERRRSCTRFVRGGEGGRSKERKLTFLPRENLPSSVRGDPPPGSPHQDVYVFLPSPRENLVEEGRRRDEAAEPSILLPNHLVHISSVLTELPFLSFTDAAPKPAYPVITPDLLAELDGFIFCFPTRYGRAPAQVSTFFDRTGGLWASGKLIGKFGGIGELFFLVFLAPQHLSN